MNRISLDIARRLKYIDTGSLLRVNSTGIANVKRTNYAKAEYCHSLGLSPSHCGLTFPKTVSSHHRRTYVSFSDFLTSTDKSQAYSERRLIGYSMEQMYQVALLKLSSRLGLFELEMFPYHLV